MSKVIHIDYSGRQFDFRDDGWFNATVAAAKFNKEPFDWLRQRDTVEYVAALSEQLIGNPGFLPEFNEISKLNGDSAVSRAKLLNLVKKTGLVKTKQGAIDNGGGTWLHPKLAVSFARWLDVKFAVWCDLQIDGLLRGQIDWQKLRHEAASSYKVMSAVLQMQRQQQGKESAPHHFMCEAKLVNWALTGEFKGVDRESLSVAELDILARLEERNSVLIGCGFSYADRKQVIERFVAELRQPALLESAA